MNLRLYILLICRSFIFVGRRLECIFLSSQFAIIKDKIDNINGDEDATTRFEHVVQQNSSCVLLCTTVRVI